MSGDVPEHQYSEECFVKKKVLQTSPCLAVTGGIPTPVTPTADDNGENQQMIIIMRE